ncbi:MAG TPA: serine/threonine-protein kinase [Kofleriaceae bacterium]|nr:serine/threonine-protein kinase [Kofleriaceae bacterium]
MAVDPISAKFDLGERLGGSRTGTVYRAIDKATGQAAAVKIIAPAVATLPGLAQRLERELKQLERVQSAGVAKVLASGKRGEDSWVAIELLDGAQTLTEVVAARGPTPLDQASRLIEVIGEALIEAAQVGVVHRDLAPKNILFASDQVKLINFSLPVPSSETIPGVPGFVAPEQYDGKSVDQRSNLYSLGALYYLVLTGRPVQVDDAGTVKMPSSLAPVPGPVEAVILRALDKSPTKRFLTVRQFVDEVDRVTRGEVEVKAPPVNGRAGKPKAELVQTLLGVQGDGGLAGPVVAAAPSAPASIAPPGPGTALGVAAFPPDRSPWAPPLSIVPPEHVVLPAAEPVVAPLVAAAPAGAALAASPVVAAPVLPPALVAAPASNPGSGKSSGKKSGKSGEDSRGKFRETMWFKKGELDAQAAQAAAEERAKTGKDVSADQPDSLPLDERYKDDGSLSRIDREKYSLRTGGTVMTTALPDGATNDSAEKISEDALIGEMKGGRNKILAIIAVGLIAAVLIIFLIVH